MAASTVSSWVPPSLPDPAAASGLILLDSLCYIADLPNNTTAKSTTSTGLPIEVTFRAARPPLVSHFCVHCPGLDFSRIGPKIVATDADLVLLRVPLDPNGSSISGWNWDHFVYRPRAQWLDLVPNPPHLGALDAAATALISREDGAWFAVAALGVRPPLYNDRKLISWEFDLLLYRSSSGSEGWISKRLSLKEFKRDKLIPLPRAVDRLYHETAKTITIGGAHGTVAWVDLWRGIFFCDVLRQCPQLQDVPLPEPARANWDRLLRNGNPGYLRDVTVSRNKDSIKYVELEWLEVLLPEEPNATPVSYADWVRNSSRKPQLKRDGWKSTTWNMAIPVGSSEGWRCDCVVDVKDINLEAGDPCLSDLMAMLSSKTRGTWKELPLGYPILSMDDDVIYLISQTRPRNMDKLAMMFAVDVRRATLRGLAELDVQKTTMNFCASEICRVPEQY
uniref:Uncharacterized protein ShContig9483 n=1 Tax=Striga hermonthica TaxID=68872 RepID=D5MRP2_STRHE|nr:hypothetical protein [Striga hermonthica]